jgi:hypothetical protein
MIDKRWVYFCQAPDCAWVSEAFQDQLLEVAEQDRICHPGYRLKELKVARDNCATCSHSGVADSRFMLEHVSPDEHGNELAVVAAWW